jgi:hypothetical protein
MSNGGGERLDLPNSRYPHVYAVVRWDSGVGPPEDNISITKVLRSAMIARQEADRLNELNRGKGKYFVMISRLVEHPEEGAEPNN